MTTHYLRYRSNPNIAQVDRCHMLLKQKISDLTLSTQIQKQANPAIADQQYITATKALIARTRDHKKFPMIYMANYRYGFRRNLWGSKGLGIIACLVSLAIVLICSGLNIGSGTAISWVGLAFVGILDLILLVVYGKVVITEWIKPAAEAYAHRLMESVEQL